MSGSKFSPKLAGVVTRAFRTRANGTDPSGLILGSIGDNTERDVVTITGDARVGINTSAPDDGLHVYDTNAARIADEFECGGDV